MVFERKEIKQEEPKTYFWTFLKWYWFIIPSFYYIVIIPRLALNEGGSLVGGEDIFTMIFQFSNYVLSGLMFVTNPIEQTRTGVADKFLKIAVIQQIMIRNIFGVVLGLLAWYQLPTNGNIEFDESEGTNNWYFKPKTIVILSIVSLVLTLLTLIGYLNLY